MYLGEHNVSVREAEVLSGAKGPEVVIEDKTPEGIIVEASIFGWHEADKSEESGYDFLGTFLGDGGVMVEPDIVTVLVRRAKTRSQLADRQIYRPRDNKSYFQDGKLVPLEPMGLTSLSMPEDPAISEYSEKVVLAFYESITDTNKLKGMMAPEAWKAFEGRDGTAFGCLVDAQRSGVLVMNMDPIPALAVPPHTENNNVVITATITATSTCIITFGGSSSRKDVTLVWQVKWQKDDPERKELDRWVLLKPSIKR